MTKKWKALINYDLFFFLEESILPDLDCEVDFGENPANIPQPVDIKKEKVRLITPSALGQISIKTEMGKSMDSENIVQGK